MLISNKKNFLSLLLVIFSVFFVFSFFQTVHAQSIDPYWLEYKDLAKTHYIKGPYTSLGACEAWWNANSSNPWILVKSCFMSATTPIATPEPPTNTPPASTKTTYTPLAPLPGIGSPDCIDAEGKPCIDTKASEKNPCPFGQYLNLLIKLFFGICGVLAVVMVLMGGIQYMTSDLVSSKEEGKNTIVHAILGLLLALGAWLILNTLNPNLLNVCLNTLPPAEITIGDTDDPISFDRNSLPSGIVCTNGQNNIPNIAKSFAGKMTYEMGAKGVAGPNNTIKLDCSGFVNYVLKCANVPFINGGTSSIFAGAEPVTSISGNKVNNIDLAIGDLLGWKAGDIPKNAFGHVMIYIGDGSIKAADSHGGSSVGNALGVFPVSNYKNDIKYIKRVGSSNSQTEAYNSAIFVPIGKLILMRVNNYDSTKNHKVMITNTIGFNRTINNANNTVIVQGLNVDFPVTLSVAEYNQLQGTSVNASIWSAGVPLGTKSVLIN